MEGELWIRLYTLVRTVASRRARQRYVQFPDWWILVGAARPSAGLGV